MSEREVLLIDIGGVVLSNGWDSTARARAISNFGLDAGFEARHRGLANDLDCGRITLDAYLDRAVFDRPQPFAKSEFIEFMQAQSQANPEMFEILDELRSAGRYLIGAFNNESAELNQYRIDRFDLRRYFDVFLSSCYLGMTKPDPAIYRRALELLQRSAADCVFVDDRSENVATALELGLRAIHYLGSAQLRPALRALGVCVGPTS